MMSVKELIEEHKGKKVAILGNGITTLHEGGYIDFSGQYDYIWTVNGGWLNHKTSNLGFMMDDWASIAHDIDVNPREVKRSKLEVAEIPIFVTAAYPGFPTMLDYPLRQVIDEMEMGYFGETTSYMVAFAILCGVKEIHMHGCDYHGCKPSERAATEFWCGVAHGRGINVAINPGSHFMNTQYDGKNNHVPMYYGYVEPTFPFGIEKNEAQGTFTIDFKADKSQAIKDFVANDAEDFIRRNIHAYAKQKEIYDQEVQVFDGGGAQTKDSEFTKVLDGGGASG